MSNTPLPSDPAAARELELLEHYPMVQAIAGRIHQRLPRSVELDDLISAGVMGLLEAHERYDQDRSVPFGAYARPRVQGAILDALRAMDWVPRSVRRKADLLAEARDALRTSLGRTPNREEMARAIDVAPEQYDRLVVKAQLRKVLSLDVPLSDDEGARLVDVVAGDTLDTLEAWQEAELRALVHDAVRRLPERERLAVAGYYLHERQLKEIGADLGVSESRACQLRRQGVERVRFKIRTYLEG